MTVVPRYELVEGWEKLPAGYVHRDVDGVAVDAQDRVYLITRYDPRVIVYQRDGTFVKSWGEGQFSPRTHGVTLDSTGNVWVVDEGNHSVRKYTADGEPLLSLGNFGVPSDTGYDGKSVASIKRGGPPFNRPTNVVVAANGDLYVADGYGNSRVHRFAADGTLLQSWGEPGTGPGQFNMPHGIFLAPDGRVFVTDRENDRIQIFSPTGEYLAQWTNVQRPTDLFVDGAEGHVYVSELPWEAGQRSFTNGVHQERLQARVSILDLEGNVVTRLGGPDGLAPGSFWAPHCLCVDSHGDLYVGEVVYSFSGHGAAGRVPPDCHTFQKFARR